MGFLSKLKKVLIPYVAISSIFFGTLGCARLNAKTIPKPEKSKLEYTIKKLEQPQKYFVKKGDSLWKIAKNKLSYDATNQNISTKIRKIQELSNLNPTKKNDTIKYVDGKQVHGSDGLVDIIHPGQELVTDITYTFDIARKPVIPKKIISSHNKPKKKYLLGLASLIPLAVVAYSTIKKKILQTPPDQMYEKVINSYNNKKSLNSIIDECREFSKKQDSLEEKIISYIKIGVKQNVALRNRYDKLYASKLGLTSEIQLMIKQKKKYKEIQEHVKGNGMNISYSTIYRIKKALA